MSQKLDRTTFKTSRLLDFFSERELTAQTGHPKAEWPLVIVKELLDNALDAAEDAEVAPAITIKVDARGITVTDNGPGISPDTVAAILDFSARVSSREAYCSPTRGAQGNALKTIAAIPFVLHGSEGRLTVSSRGIRHEIAVKVDTIRQEPLIDHRQTPARNVRIGTSITVHWPDSASSILTSAQARFLLIASDYTYLNPHLSLTVDWFGQRTQTKATDAKWPKWMPGKPTSALWYDTHRFERFISARLANDADAGRDRTVREVIAEFAGLAGTAKQKTVLDGLGLHRAGLSALRHGEGLNHQLTAKVLGAMKAESRPIKPAALGVLGKSHLEQRLRELCCEMKTFEYRKAMGDSDGVPWLIETAFAWRGDNGGASGCRRLITGVNWSPGIVNPFRQLGKLGEGLDSVLEKQRAGRNEPVVLLLHLACPRVNYTDRGKSAVVIAGANERDEEGDDL